MVAIWLHPFLMQEDAKSLPPILVSANAEMTEDLGMALLDIVSQLEGHTP